MKKIWMMTVYDCYSGNKWLPDYARAFARKDDAEKHAEELRTMPNPMKHEITVQAIGYEEEE